MHGIDDDQRERDGVNTINERLEGTLRIQIVKGGTVCTIECLRARETLEKRRLKGQEELRKQQIS